MKSLSDNAKLRIYRNVQAETRPGAVYNGRPFELSAASVAIYHPVYAAFLAGMS